MDGVNVDTGGNKARRSINGKMERKWARDGAEVSSIKDYSVPEVFKKCKCPNGMQAADMRRCRQIASQDEEMRVVHITAIQAQMSYQHARRWDGGRVW